MMDLSDAKQSSQNAEDFRSEDEILEQETASNNAPEEISDKINFENIADGEKTAALDRQRNYYFEKETESWEFIKNICKSFNPFQKTIVDTDKTTFLNDAFYDHASITERSPPSCTSGNLLANTSEPRIRVITETNEKNDDIDKKIKFLHDALNYYNSVKESSRISSTSSNLLPNTSEHRIHAITETNKRNVRHSETIHTRASPTMECSTSGSVIIPKCENLPPISNARFVKSEMQYDIFKEDDDWDIYRHGFEMTKTESLQESEFSFERQMNEIAEYWANNEAKNSLDFYSCKRVSPHTEQGIRYSPSDNFVNNGGTFREWKIERMLKIVNEFFLNNPVQVTDYLGDLETKMCITTAPYFSKDFALRYGLLLPTDTSILQTNLPEDPSKRSKLFAAYELISSLGISEEDFFHYISIDEQRRSHTSSCELNGISALDQRTISDLDLIQEQVGTEIFYMVYKQLKTDEYFRALFGDGELLKNTILYWNGCEKNTEHLGEQATNIEYNEADSTSDVVTEDIYFSQTNADFPSTTSGSHVIKIPQLVDLDSNSFSDDGTNADFQSTTSGSRAMKTSDLNYLDSNSYADDRKEDDLKNIQYSKDLPKVQSVKPIGILETEWKCSPMMQSTNEDNKENLSSFDLLQGCLDKSNKSPGLASFMLQNIENSFHQYDEETPRKVHLVTSRTSPNDATHSFNQTFKGKSRDDQSEKSFEALENVSKVQPRVRKYSSQDDDAKSIKKIRLQENPNIGQQKIK